MSEWCDHYERLRLPKLGRGAWGRDLKSIIALVPVSERAAEVAPLFNLFLNNFDDGKDWDASHMQAVGYKLSQMFE